MLKRVVVGGENFAGEVGGGRCTSTMIPMSILHPVPSRAKRSIFIMYIDPT